MCVCDVFVGVHGLVHIWRLEDIFVELILSTFMLVLKIELRSSGLTSHLVNTIFLLIECVCVTSGEALRR